MGILSRFKTIMASNINALLDKAEDPSKMVDQLLRDLMNDLSKVKAETAGVMAEETRAKRALNECEEEITKLGRLAEKAILAGNDDDARVFLKQKALLSEKLVSLRQTADLATANATKMRQMHDKLTEEIQGLNARRESIKAKIAVAKTQERVNAIGSTVSRAQDGMGAFDRIEQKADAMLDKANAMAELGRPADNGVAELSRKYAVDNAVVDDELAALKAKLGK